MSQQPTLNLMPEWSEKPTAQDVSLDILPQDSLIPGDPPSAQFVKTVQTYGILEPVILTRRDGKFVICAGRRRVKAARAAGLTHIPARIYSPTWTPSEVIALIENEQRTENPVSDLHAIESLIKQGADIKQIALATGMSTATIRARMKLLALIPELRTALDAGAIRGSIAKECALLPPDRQREMATLLEEKGRLYRDDVRSASTARTTAAIEGLVQLFETPGAPSLEPPDAAAGNMPHYAALLQDALLALPEDTPESYRKSLAKLSAWASKKA